MNLLLITRKIWRYKLATLPILAFVLVGAFYVVAIKKPVYEATSSYILVNPPAPPTPDQIARDPRLGRIDSDNPYTRYSDQSVVVQVLGSRLSSDEARRALVQKGADPNYTAAPSAEFGYTAPILQITGTGATAQAAITTAEVVGRAATHELEVMQEAQGVDENYWIDTQQVVAPHEAQLKASGQLRSLVGVLALGGILLFIVVSVSDAVAALRRERAGGRAGDGAGEDIAGGAPLESVLSLNPDSAEHAPTPGSPEEGSPEPDAGTAAGSNGSATRSRLSRRGLRQEPSASSR